MAQQLPLGIDQPADKPLMRLRPVAEPDPDWLARHEGLVSRARAGDVDLYLQGDSITDMWQSVCTAHFQKTFSRWKTGNFAISGDRTEHVLWRITHGELDGVKPRVIVLNIGTNNLPSIQGVYTARQPEEVASGVRAIVDVFQERLPEAQILLHAIFPREDRLFTLPPAISEDLNPKIKQLNGMLATIARERKLHYLDIHDHFLSADGKLLPGVMPDKLHPTERGYDIWAASLVPALSRLLNE